MRQEHQANNRFQRNNSNFVQQYPEKSFSTMLPQTLFKSCPLPELSSLNETTIPAGTTDFEEFMKPYYQELMFQLQEAKHTIKMQQCTIQYLNEKIAIKDKQINQDKQQQNRNKNHNNTDHRLYSPKLITKTSASINSTHLDQQNGNLAVNKNQQKLRYTQKNSSQYSQKLLVKYNTLKSEHRIILKKMQSLREDQRQQEERITALIEENKRLDKQLLRLVQFCRHNHFTKPNHDNSNDTPASKKETQSLRVQQSEKKKKRNNTPPESICNYDHEDFEIEDVTKRVEINTKLESMLTEIQKLNQQKTELEYKLHQLTNKASKCCQNHNCLSKNDSRVIEENDDNMIESLRNRVKLLQAKIVQSEAENHSLVEKIKKMSLELQQLAQKSQLDKIAYETQFAHYKDVISDRWSSLVHMRKNQPNLGSRFKLPRNNRNTEAIQVIESLQSEHSIEEFKLEEQRICKLNYPQQFDSKVDPETQLFGQKRKIGGIVCRRSLQRESLQELQRLMDRYYQIISRNADNKEMAFLLEMN